MKGKYKIKVVKIIKCNEHNTTKTNATDTLKFDAKSIYDLIIWVKLLYNNMI